MKKAPLIVLLLSVIAGAWGQARDPFDVRGADLVILQAKPVQAELHISEAQRAQMNAAADAHRGRLKAYDQQLTASKARPDEKKLLDYLMQLRDKVFSILTPAQLKRLREISLQRAGMVALVDDQVAARVGLTPPQLKRIRDAIQQDHTKVSAIEHQAADPVMKQYQGKKPKNQQEAMAMQKDAQTKMAAIATQIRPRLDAIMSADRKQILSLLTPSQAAAWKQLLGKPFVVGK